MTRSEPTIGFVPLTARCSRGMESHEGNCARCRARSSLYDRFGIGRKFEARYEDAGDGEAGREEVRRQDGEETGGQEVRRQEGQEVGGQEVRRQEGQETGGEEVRRQEGKEVGGQEVR